MHAIELLKADHRRVNDLFNLIELETELPKRRNIFKEITSELELHMHIEELVLYAFFSKQKGFGNKVEHSYDEHQEVKSLLLEIQVQSNENEFDNLVGELVKSVRHHVREEENDLFPKMETILSTQEWETLGQKLQEAKQTPIDSSVVA
jgi:hemerythrin superfamily protein